MVSGIFKMKFCLNAILVDMSRKLTKPSNLKNQNCRELIGDLFDDSSYDPEFTTQFEEY